MGTGGARDPERMTPERAHAAKAKGRAAEDKVLDAFARHVHPWWITKVRRARAHEDRGGVDVVIATDTGRMYLQVKSSAHNAARWLREHAHDRRPIGVIVVRPRDDVATVYGRALGALIRLREQQEPATTTTRQ